MAIMKSKDGNDLVIDCDCGCDEGLRIRITDFDDDKYCILTYTSGNFYKDQEQTIGSVISKKAKKIWKVLRNKDYCYSEIIMTKDEFKEFKEYVANLK